MLIMVLSKTLLSRRKKIYAYVSKHDRSTGLIASLSGVHFYITVEILSSLERSGVVVCEKRGKAMYWKRTQSIQKGGQE